MAFAHGLADAGADVVVAARRVERLEEVRAKVEARGRRCLAVRADVAEPDDCTRVATEAMEALGRVDVLVNNAGIGTAAPATRETPEQFRQVIDINLNGSYWMAQACGRVMGAGSSIVNIGSVLGSTTGGPAAGRLRGQQGGDHRPDARPGPAVDRAARASASTRWRPASSTRR